MHRPAQKKNINRKTHPRISTKNIIKSCALPVNIGCLDNPKKKKELKAVTHEYKDNRTILDHLDLRLIKSRSTTSKEQQCFIISEG